MINLEGRIERNGVILDIEHICASDNLLEIEYVWRANDLHSQNLHFSITIDQNIHSDIEVQRRIYMLVDRISERVKNKLQPISYLRSDGTNYFGMPMDVVVRNGSKPQSTDS